MVVVTCFLHQVEDCPHQRIANHGKAVPGANHNKGCQHRHRTDIPVHARPGECMKELKPDESKSERRRNKMLVYGTVRYCTYGMQHQQETKHDPESDQGSDIHLPE